jgi:hypothetical protein
VPNPYQGKLESGDSTGQDFTADVHPKKSKLRLLSKAFCRTITPCKTGKDSATNSKITLSQNSVFTT